MNHFKTAGALLLVIITGVFMGYNIVFTKENSKNQIDYKIVLDLPKEQLSEMTIQLNFFNSDVNITGYQGDNLIIENDEGKKLDIELKHKNTTVFLSKSSEMETTYNIMVPSKCSVVFKEELRKPKKITIKGLENVLMADVYNSSLVVEGFKGEIMAKSAAGTIDVEFVDLIKNKKHSLISEGSIVRVKFPSQPKVDLNIVMNAGPLESAFDLGVFEVGDIGVRKIKTQLNGGGPEIMIKAHTCILEK